MDVKDLRIDSGLGTNISNGSIKYVPSGKISHPERKTYSSNIDLQSLGKLDTQVSRPCAIIGPDRVLAPVNSNESLGKTGPQDLWSCPDGYRQLYEHPLKMSEFPPSRNISPRQTFQENMQRIMVPPTYNTIKSSDEPSLKNNKLNMPPEAKYCDVPFTINSVNNEHKPVRNADIPVSNMNPAFTRNVPGIGYQGVSVRPLRPYPAPEIFQYPEYSNLTGPRQMPIVRSQRGYHDESAQIYSERLYQDANLRFKPYPTIKERYPQTRYEYISSCANSYPPPYPTHKFDISKSLQNHPYPMYPQAPLKYIDRRIPEPIMDGFQRPPNPHVNMNTFRNHIPPPYGPIPGNCYQNKSYPYSSDSTKSVPLNKLPYDTSNRVYLDLDNSRHKMYPPENFYYNDHNQLLRGDIVIPGHPLNSVSQHPMYRKDSTLLKSYDYPSHYRNIDQSVNSGSRIPLQFSPNTIAISPCDSNASNETSHTMGALQEDCGYVSQSSTTSLKSFDNGITNGIYKRQDYQNLISLHGRSHKTELNTKANLRSKKSLDVRQFLQMWNEGDEDSENKDAPTQSSSNHSTTNEEQLYVLGLVNVPNEELGKYDHLQKLSKLPENIKGYNYIELLNQYEKLVESPNFNNIYTKSSRDYAIVTKNVPKTNKDISPRPLSPLDVEAKISQSVIHKEVGCNFEIKPCSPKLLNVDIATPVHDIIRERIIEKVTNPVLMNVVNVKDSIGNSVDSMPSSCNLSGKQYLDSNKSNNYNLQDLETNPSVCLASLPQLDNDIELNFPEVNQQFINATKTDTSVSKSTELKCQNTKNKSEFISNPDISMHTINKESTKLSRFRKVKKSDIMNKESELPFKDSELNVDNPSSIQQRIDSVIIKNPDNTKFYASSYTQLQKNNSTNKSMSNETTESLKNCFSESSSSTVNTKIREQDLCVLTAIDFSLNKSDYYSAKSNINTNDEFKICNAKSYKNQESNEINTKSNSFFDNSALNNNINEEPSEEVKEAKLYVLKKMQENNKMDSEVTPENITTENKECNKISSENKLNICDILNDSLLKNATLNNNIANEVLSDGLGESEIFLTKIESLHNDNNDNNEDFKENITILPQKVENILNTSFENNSSNHDNIGELFSNNLEDAKCIESKEIQIKSTVTQKIGSPEIMSNKNPNFEESDIILSQKPEESLDSSSSNTLLIQDSLNYNIHNKELSDELNENKLFSSSKLQINCIVTDFEKSSINNPTEENLQIEPTKAIASEQVSLEEILMQNEVVNDTLVFPEMQTFLENKVGMDREIIKNVDLNASNDKFSVLRDCYIEGNMKAGENKLEILSEEVKFPKELKHNFLEDNEEYKTKNDSKCPEDTFIEGINSISVEDVLNEDSVLQDDIFLNSKDISLDYSVVPECEPNTILLNKNNVLEHKCVTTVKGQDETILTPNLKVNCGISPETLVQKDIQQSNLSRNCKENYENGTDDLYKATIKLGLKSEGDTLNKNIKKNNFQLLENDENNTSQITNMVSENNEQDSSEPMEIQLLNIDKIGDNIVTPDLNNEVVIQKDEVHLLKQKIEKTFSWTISEDNQVTKKISKPNARKLSKELLSPWIQKLVLHAEGVYIPTTHSNFLVNNTNSPVTINNVTCIDNKIIDTKNFIDTNESQDFQTLDEKLQQFSTTLKSNDADKIEKISPDNNISFENNSNDEKTASKYKIPLASFDGCSPIKRRMLKRSLSESALEAYSGRDDKETFFSKRSKLMEADFCNIIQTNRRNSIAEIYNEDVYILIDDNNYLITEDETEKICYTDILPIHSNVDTNIETMHIDNEYNCKFCDSSLLVENIEEKALNDTWVEDVACMETIFNDDIAEDIVISAPSSPNASVNLASDVDETLQCEEVIEHMEKVKDIYGGNMCNIDAQLVETLYRTPQMNVNKTLVCIETPVTEVPGTDASFYPNIDNDLPKKSNVNTEDLMKDCDVSFDSSKEHAENTGFKENFVVNEFSDISLINNTTHVTIENIQKSNSDVIKDCKNNRRTHKYCISSSPEVSSTTSEERNSTILLKISSYNGSRISHIEGDDVANNKKISYKLTENHHYKTFSPNYNSSGVLITKAAQKYIPPTKETIPNLNLKVKLPLPPQSLNKLKQLKKSKAEPKINKKLPNLNNLNLNNLKSRHDIVKKPKPKFEDVLMNIDKIHLKKHKDVNEKTKRLKDDIPKVVIKKNENGAHYASSSNSINHDKYNPDLTGRKWQPWVFLEKNIFIDKMAMKNKEKAIFCHRKNSYVLAEKFRKYKSIYNAKFVISQPKPGDITKGNLKYTIRLKHY